jgi:branched-subunit amino acid transport protein
MSQQTKAMIKSWANVFIAAVITALLVVIVDTNTLALDWKTVEAVLIAGLVAVLPVIKNYFDPSDPRYGKVAKSNAE